RFNRLKTISSGLPEQPPERAGALVKIASFSANGRSRLGKIDGDTIIDLSVATPDLPSSLVEVLRLGSPALKRIADAKTVAGPGLPLESVKLLAPVPNPSKY